METRAPSFPNLAQITRSRIACPEPAPDPMPSAHELGSAVLRQLFPGSAPGGEKRMRLSGLGHCARKQAFKVRGVEPLGPVRTQEARVAADLHSKIAFLDGDVTEVYLTLALCDALARGVAPGFGLSAVRGGEVQGEVRLRVDLGHPPSGKRWLQVHGLALEVDADGCAQLLIDGHPDGLITRDGQPYGVLEVKTTKSYKAKAWRTALAERRCPWDVSEDYWWQIQAYMHCMDLPQGYVLVRDKSAALEMGASPAEKIFGWWMRRDGSFMARVAEHVERFLLTDPTLDSKTDIEQALEVLPVRADGKKIEFYTNAPPCGWCEFVGHCAAARGLRI